jgi:hypothetical protein
MTLAYDHLLLFLRGLHFKAQKVSASCTRGLLGDSCLITTDKDKQTMSGGDHRGSSEIDNNRSSGWPTVGGIDARYKMEPYEGTQNA